MTFTEMAFFPANFMLQNPHEDDHHQTPSAVNVNHIIPSCTPQDIHGFPPSSLFGVNVASLGAKRGMSFSGIDVVEEANGEEDLSDDGSQTGEKKRRLNMEQVKTLENNFELGNKLEPERKMKLARALGLQPRQIAIWFQNRRARWKTKQLEKDYELLKKQFDVLKAENEALQEQNFKLQSEVLALKSREATEAINLNKEIHDQGSCSTNTNGSENSSDVKLDVSGASPATNSPSSNHPVSRSDLFPTPSSVRPVPQLIFQKTELHHQPPSKEESFCNMFCGIDEQSGLWPWLEQQHFH